MVDCTEINREKIFLCSFCIHTFPYDERTVIPTYNKGMEMLVTTYVCSDCLPEAIEQTKAYLQRAQVDQPWRKDGGLKFNTIIEAFVGFLLRHRMTDLAISIRYANSLEDGIQKVNQLLDRLQVGEIWL